MNQKEKILNNFKKELHEILQEIPEEQRESIEEKLYLSSINYTMLIDSFNKRPYHYNSVFNLQKILKEENIPDDAEIVVERVPDVYFEKEDNGWIEEILMSNSPDETSFHSSEAITYDKEKNLLRIWCFS